MLAKIVILAMGILIGTEIAFLIGNPKFEYTMTIKNP